MISHPHDSHWITEHLAGVPVEFHSLVNTSYSGLYEKHGRQAANLWLLETVPSLHVSGLQAMPPHERYAAVSHILVTQFSLEKAVAWAGDKGVRVPRCPAAVRPADASRKNSRESIAARLRSPEWWQSQLSKKRRRDAEAAQIRAGNVCKGVSPYVSTEAVGNYEHGLAAQEAWKKQTLLVSSEGDEVSMDASQHEHSKSFMHFAEFMTRVNGMAAIAADNYVSDDLLMQLPDITKHGTGGAYKHVASLSALAASNDYVGIAFTLTCPSRFHRYKSTKGKLSLNPHYDSHKTPADARDWLQETWKLTQTAWKRDTKHIDPIEGFGFRVDESHHDGVSHYHYAIWVKGGDAERATRLFYNKALRGEYTDYDRQQDLCQHGLKRDRVEAGAKQRRLNFKVMTSAKGMVSYMVKYITKGITGADWEDLTAGETADKTLININARKQVWGIRQFAFWNSPSVMVWRELRALEAEQENALLESCRKAARDGDWKRYTELNGGATCAANQRPIAMLRLTKTDAATGKPTLNQYGEAVEQIRGLLVHGEALQTRLKDWYLLNMGSLKQLLVDKFAKQAGKENVPVTFGEDIDAVIAQAQSKGRVMRLACTVGIEPFSRSMTGALVPLGLVGITSHDQQGRVLS